eukprot:GHVH01004962.1.p1 GENE.GHVH01004962.1~~GHVH01004962.1.p1  ORF type:complete len:849 (+),score=110.18 GHVH01004962.1:12-2558(+)
MPVWTQRETALTNQIHQSGHYCGPFSNVVFSQTSIGCGGIRNKITHADYRGSRSLYSTNGNEVRRHSLAYSEDEGGVRVKFGSVNTWRPASLQDSVIQEIRSNSQESSLMPEEGTLLAVRGPKQLAVARWSENTCEPLIDLSYVGRFKGVDAAWRGRNSRNNPLGNSHLQQVRFNPLSVGALAVLHGNNTLSSFDLYRGAKAEIIPLSTPTAESGVVSDLCYLQGREASESLSSFCYTHHPDIMVFAGLSILLWDRRTRRARVIDHSKGCLFETNGALIPRLKGIEPAYDDRGYGGPMFPCTGSKSVMQSRGFCPRDYNQEYLRPSISSAGYSSSKVYSDYNRPHISAVACAGRENPHLLSAVDSQSAVVTVFDLRNSACPLASIPLPVIKLYPSSNRWRELQWVHHPSPVVTGYCDLERVSDSIIVTDALHDQSFNVSLNVHNSKSVHSTSESEVPMWKVMAESRRTIKSDSSTIPPFYCELYPSAQTSSSVKKSMKLPVNLTDSEAKVYRLLFKDTVALEDDFKQLSKDSDPLNAFLMKNMFSSDVQCSRGSVTDGLMMERFGEFYSQYEVEIEEHTLGFDIDEVDAPPTQMLSPEVQSLAVPPSQSCLDGPRSLGDRVLPSAVDVRVLEVAIVDLESENLESTLGGQRFSIMLGFPISFSGAFSLMVMVLPSGALSVVVAEQLSGPPFDLDHPLVRQANEEAEILAHHKKIHIIIPDEFEKKPTAASSVDDHRTSDNEIVVRSAEVTDADFHRTGDDETWCDIKDDTLNHVVLQSSFTLNDQSQLGARLSKHDLKYISSRYKSERGILQSSLNMCQNEEMCVFGDEMMTTESITEAQSVEDSISR